MKRIVIIIGIIVIVLGLMATAGFFLRKKLSAILQQSAGISVRVENPEIGELIEYVSAPGHIEPKSNVKISAKISGRIMKLPYKEGDRVTCGDPNANPPIEPSLLIQLDSREMESQLTQAKASREASAAQLEVEKKRLESQRASLRSNEANIAKAELDLERQQKRFDSGDIAVTMLEEANLRVEELKAQYDAAQYSLAAAEGNLNVMKYNLDAADARIESAEESLRYTKIESPIDGTVIRLNAEVGEIVMTGTMNNQGTVIMIVGDLSQMLVVAEVDESDVGKLKVGQKVVVQVDAYEGQEFEGEVYSIAFTSDQSRTGTKYYKTEVLLDETPVQLHSDLTAHVDIEAFKYSDVLKVPSQAVMDIEIDSLPLSIRDDNKEIDTSKTYAIVVYRYIEHKAVVTPVTIGNSDLTHTIIKSGLTKEDKVIVGPYRVLEMLRHNMNIIDEREKQDKKAKEKADNVDSNDTEEPNNN